MITKYNIYFPIDLPEQSDCISIEHFGFHITKDVNSNTITELSYKKGCTVSFSIDNCSEINIKAFYNGKVIKTSPENPFTLGEESDLFTFAENGFVFSSDHIDFRFDDSDLQPLANFNPLTKQRFHLIFEGTFTIEYFPENGFSKSDKIASCSSTFTVYGITEDGSYFDPIKHILELLQLPDTDISIDNKFKNGLKIYSPTLIKHNAIINVIGYNGSEVDSAVGLVKKQDINNDFFNDIQEFVVWIVDENSQVNITYETWDRFNLIIIGNENKPSLTTVSNTINSIIKLSRVSRSGGVYKPFNLELNGLEFKNGKSDKGGAISCYSLDSVIIRNCSFINNIANQYGGAIYFEDCENVLISSDIKLNIDYPNINQEHDCSITHNTNATNCLFKENSSSKGGGAIEAIATNITLNNCVFNNNKVQNLNTEKSGYGGAIGFTQESISTGKSFLVRYINIYSSVFNSNSSNLGGAFALTSWDNLSFMVGDPGNDSLGSLDETLLTISYPRAIIKDCLMQNNEALRGGAMLIVNLDYDITNSYFNCNRCIDGNNKRDGNGASICNYVNVKGIIKNCTFLYGDAGVGGAIYSSVTMGLRLSKKIIIEDSYFKNNKAYNGGALRFTGGTSLEVKGSIFDSNYAEGDTGFGGAISFRTAQVNIKEGVNFINNIAKKGGAIHGGGFWLIARSQNWVDHSGYLPLIANFTSSLIIEGDNSNKVNFKNNQSYEEGAAIYVVRDWLCFSDDFNKFTIKECHLENNEVNNALSGNYGGIITLAGFNPFNPSFQDKKIFSLNQDLFDINQQDCDLPFSSFAKVIFNIKNVSIRHTDNLLIFSLINSNSVIDKIKEAINVNPSNLEITPPVEDVEDISSYIKEEEL